MSNNLRNFIKDNYAYKLKHKVFFKRNDFKKLCSIIFVIAIRGVGKKVFQSKPTRLFHTLLQRKMAKLSRILR